MDFSETNSEVRQYICAVFEGTIGTVRIVTSTNTLHPFFEPQ